jgi:hypothetical protein
MSAHERGSLSKGNPVGGLQAAGRLSREIHSTRRESFEGGCHRVCPPRELFERTECTTRPCLAFGCQRICRADSRESQSNTAWVAASPVSALRGCAVRAISRQRESR